MSEVSWETEAVEQACLCSVLWAHTSFITTVKVMQHFQTRWTHMSRAVVGKLVERSFTSYRHEFPTHKECHSYSNCCIIFRGTHHILIGIDLCFSYESTNWNLSLVIYNRVFFFFSNSALPVRLLDIVVKYKLLIGGN